MKASVAELTRLPGVWRGGELAHAAQPAVGTGHAALDAELPGHGWPTGCLTEVLHDEAGIGEVSFLFHALARACAGERLVAWINAPYLPYAPALAQAGLPLAHCLVLRPATREDALWATEQALRSGACGAVLSWLGAGTGHNEYAALRRLHMAAEAGRCLAVSFRAGAAERLSTPAHLRVALTREEGRLMVRIAKRRGPPLATPIALEAGYALGLRQAQPERKTMRPQSARPGLVEGQTVRPELVEEKAVRPELVEGRTQPSILALPTFTRDPDAPRGKERRAACEIERPSPRHAFRPVGR